MTMIKMILGAFTRQGQHQHCMLEKSETFLHALYFGLIKNDISSIFGLASVQPFICCICFPQRSNNVRETNVLTPWGSCQHTQTHSGGAVRPLTSLPANNTELCLSSSKEALSLNQTRYIEKADVYLMTWLNKMFILPSLLAKPHLESDSLLVFQL